LNQLAADLGSRESPPPGLGISGRNLTLGTRTVREIVV
jgi:hypothetical protein